MYFLQGMGFSSFHLSSFLGRFCTLLPVQTHKGFPKRKALCFITSAFSDCLTFSALALCPQFTDAAFHRMVCDGCYHARTIPDGEQLPSAVIAHRERPGFPEAGVDRSLSQREVMARPSARLSQRACCLKKLFTCQGTPCRRGQTVTGSGAGRPFRFGSPSIYNGQKSAVC